LFDEIERKLEIIFFEPVDEDYFFKEFKLEPKIEGKYIFSDSNKKVTFTPRFIEEEKEYKAEILGKELSFKIESPKVKKIYFDEAKEQIVVEITKPVKEEEITQTLKISPSLEKTLVFNSKKTKVTIKLEGLKEGQSYSLKVLDKELSFGLTSVRVRNIYFDKDKQQVFIVFSRPIEKSKFLKSFKVTPPLEGKFTFSSEKDWVIFKPNKIEKNKLYTVTVFGARLSFKVYPISVSKKNGTRYIDVDISSQTLRLYQRGSIVGSYPISSGRPGMPTPTGTFRVLSKERLHWSTRYSLYMPYSLQFYNGYYIHELPYWPGGYREGESHLGIPVSHGCIRLGIGPAATVYNFADIGTKIVIHQ
jgi:lipoprotein-anchoring transpeptidase ErfK/SrfK